MDYLNCILKLRPNVSWKDNQVNGFSLNTIAKTYQHTEPIPTEQDCIDVLPELELEAGLKEAEKQEIIDEQANFKGVTLSTREQWVKDRLQETTLDTASKIALGKIFRKLIAFTE